MVTETGREVDEGLVAPFVTLVLLDLEHAAFAATVSFFAFVLPLVRRR